MNAAQEINFDGLVGPTHNYAGLSHGNIASISHRGAASNPRQAALEGLRKMKQLADLGILQAVLPPHDRPSVEMLRRFGFGGSDAEILRLAAEHAPGLLVACGSASAMWVANAATVTPSADTADRRTHFTPANLVSRFHRSIEPPQTSRTLQAIFRDPNYFVVHQPIPAGQGLGDEGAANHTRLTPSHGRSGIHLFAYGHRAFGAPATAHSTPRTFPSRQALESSEAIARCHGISTTVTVFAQQHPEAIDAGVFHNDVISVGNESVFLYHERAFVETGRVISELQRKFAHAHPGAELCAIAVPSQRISLADAVRSYLFNSQLVTLRPGTMALIAPSECQQVARVHEFIDELIASGKSPIAEVHYLDLNQSMRNGGGPACLRLRVVLTADERATLPSVFLTTTTYAQLVAWVEKNYREHLLPADLADPILLEENRRALDQLTQLLGVGSIYSFQREQQTG